MLEHPDITWCLETGYPRDKQPTTIRCDICRQFIDTGEVYEDDEYECLCIDCLKQRYKKIDWED